ncbi:hemerythrin domain-containing protein [Streptomyces sp. NBC_00669]|uniref:hemerythrin domain-containing protein n=1 Tax=Streptomyces sp. NBC_00669 TaxID=2976011 RepID=UPI002E2F00C0|nr:hemerythrin domain-containing protein [Streptomyces sp. NBC_00669]
MSSAPAEPREPDDRHHPSHEAEPARPPQPAAPTLPAGPAESPESAESAAATSRPAALGRELVEIHDWLRAELAQLRAEVELHLDGRPSPGRQPSRPLTAHCLYFCAALTGHHRAEDAGAFPLLAEEFPQLRPTIEKLAEDHLLVGEIMSRLETVVAGIPATPSDAEARRVRGELDGLAAILESHFTFEEKRIAAALDALPGTGRRTAADLLGTVSPDSR